MPSLIHSVSVLLLFCLLGGPSQAATNEVRELSVSSPRDCMFTFIHAVKRYSQQPALWESVERTLDTPPTMDEVAVETAAVRLYGILNRLGRISPHDLPGEENLGDLERFMFYPNSRLHTSALNQRAGAESIVLSRTPSGDWKFSRETVLGISTLYRALEGESLRYGTAEILISPSLWLRSKMPESWQGASFATLALWQWVGLFAMIVAGFMVDGLFRILVRSSVLRWIQRSGGRAERETIEQFLKPFGMFVGASLVLLILPILGLHQPQSALAGGIIRGATLFLVVVSASWSLWRVTDLVAEVLMSRASRTENKLDDVLIPLIRKAVKVFIALFGTIYAAESINLPIKPLLASLGIGGLAFAFAAKDTIENLFGSIAVILDRPFHVGDWVVIGKTEGTVEEVGFRSTRIRTFYNSLVTVPNASLVRAEVDNFGQRRFRRVKCHLGLQYDTPPDKIIAFTEGIRELVRTHPYTRKDYFQVYFNQFGPSSLDVLLYVFHETPDWSTELRERERLFLDILRLADQLGVKFAFPTQTLHLMQQQEDPPAGPIPAEDSDQLAAEMGRAAAQVLTAGQAWKKEKPGPV